MKKYAYIGMLIVGAAFTGCSPSPSNDPVIRGELKFCKFRLDGSSSQYIIGGQIDVYEHFICVTETNGVKHVGSFDAFSEVSFK